MGGGQGSQGPRGLVDEDTGCGNGGGGGRRRHAAVFGGRTELRRGLVGWEWDCGSGDAMPWLS